MNLGPQTHSKAPFRMPVARQARPDIATHPWFWNPRNEAAEPPPASFAARLRAIDPHLALCRNKVTGKWQLWVKAPRVNHPLCQGWSLLFVHHDAQGRALPLDERIFARLYLISAETWGSSKAYFDRILHEYDRDKERRDRQFDQDSIDAAMPSFEFSKIKVGYGPSNGSKFSTFVA